MELTPNRILALAKRASDAKSLLDDHRVHRVIGHVEADLYIVTGIKGSYQVRLNATEPCPWRCSCPDWEWRGNDLLGHCCKHVLACLMFADANPPEVNAVRSKPQIEDLETKLQDLYK
jgi:hypothetical protein